MAEFAGMRTMDIWYADLAEDELDLGGTSLKLGVADDVRTEFEVEVTGDEIEVEIELTWSTAPGGRGRKA
jgi:hypothetical protein